MNTPPAAPATEAELEAVLATPDDATRDALDGLDGDVMILGAGGKMGPSLARLARQALRNPHRRVVAVSRFQDGAVMDALRANGIETHRADLANPAHLAPLPDIPNIIWMAGQKFGTTGDPVGTWTQNVVASTLAAERFAGARIVCFSTGNVYGRSPVAEGGSTEDAPLIPDGEYAASCIGRERVFESVAQRTGSALLLFRLFYANDLRYGVVTEIARKVLHGEPVDCTTGHVNVIWQGDANRLALRALTLAAVPARALNVTGNMVTVREIAERCAQHAGTTAALVGHEGASALIANVSRLETLLPYAALPLDTLCAWAVQWIRQQGRLLNKPTKFDVRDGRF